MSRQFSQPGAVERLISRYDITQTLYNPPARPVVAPGNRIAAIIQNERGERLLTGFRWGLIPYWETDLADDHRYTTARAESIADKRTFRWALRERRCLIPATAFFEWMKMAGRSIPLSYRPLKDDAIWSFAGIWDEWEGDNGAPLRTCAIVTVEANPLVDAASKRMPAILRPGDEEKWLDGSISSPADLVSLLRPLPVRAMQVEADDERIVNQLYEAAEMRNAKPRPRVVRRDFVSPDGQVFFKTRSFTRPEYIHWHPVIDTHEGRVWCDCPDFRFRHAHHEPDLSMPSHWCKHVARAVDNCRRHGEVAVAS